MIRARRWPWLALSVLALGAGPRIAEAQTSRAFISANLGVQASSTDFTRDSTISVNQEIGPLTARYSVGSGAVFDAGGAFQIRPKLWLGAALSRFTKSGSADVTADVPHPFFFNRHRTIAGTATDLQRAETAVHVSAMWDLAMAGRWQVKVFGGPTFFSSRQDLVTVVTFEETFPFDIATYTGEDTEESSASGVGFHVGADISTYLTPSIGVGALLRYSRGEVTFGDVPDDVSATTGGMHIAGGIRFRF